MHKLHCATTLLFCSVRWVVPEKIHSPLGTEEISTIRRGGEKKLFLIIVSVLGHSNFGGDRGLTSNFLHGRGINVLWKDPMSDDFTCQ
jgi:hypothetical protein